MDEQIIWNYIKDDQKRGGIGEPYPTVPFVE